MALLVLRCIEDDGGDEGADGDGQLVETYDQSTDSFWRALGLIHGHETADSANWEG